MDILIKMEIEVHTFEEDLYIDHFLPEAEEFESTLSSTEDDYNLTEEDLEGLSLGGKETSLDDF